ncbi:YopX family protein [Virgibacillus sp. CBA3643]|uniref:YopX family protein n=1 Tax=Virgibacillus sp. CBA3643 TaxID=2942278 RepID=UPI0035A3BC27
MREIKYRAKVLKKKNWIYRQPFHIRGTWYMYSSLWDVVPIDFHTIRQYTGSEDVNGNEIYEGDIVKYEVSSGVTKKGTITFDGGCFGTKFWYLDEMKKIEVVGNDVDNPKMLAKMLEGETYV